MTLNKALTSAIAVLALAAATTASAVQIKMGNTDNSSVGYYRANPMGDFENILDNYALGKSTDGNWFGTFCIEKNEYFTPGAVYDVTFNNGAISGGKGGATNGKDIISKGTAWLYEQYAIGNFFGTIYNPYNLQKAIWFLEDELHWSDLGGNAKDLVELASTSLGLLPSAPNDWSLVKSDYTGKNVQVMNLTSNNGTKQHQDQLVYNPVPDTGSTLALLGFASIGLLSLRRRIR